MMINWGFLSCNDGLSFCLGQYVISCSTTQQIVITCISNTEIADDWKFKPVITGLNSQSAACMLLEVTLTELKFIVEKGSINKES